MNNRWRRATRGAGVGGYSYCKRERECECVTEAMKIKGRGLGWWRRRGRMDAFSRAGFEGKIITKCGARSVVCLGSIYCSVLGLGG